MGIYIVGGGYGSNYRPEITTNIDSSSYASWQTVANLPQGTIWMASSDSGPYMYILGGAYLETGTLKISRKTYSYNRITNAVQELNSLPLSLAKGGSASYNGWLYHFGGVTSVSGSHETVSNFTYKAQINADGTIGPWLRIADLPNRVGEFAYFRIDNRILIIGGLNSNSVASDDIYIGTIELNGDIQWSTSGIIPTTLRRPAFTAAGDQIYLIGGYDGTKFTTDTYTTNYVSDPSLSSWFKITPILPHGDCCNAATYDGENIVMFGGHDGAMYYDSVMTLKILSGLNIEDLKQHQEPWGVNEYDHASDWAPANKIGIDRWGCALTGASMILKYHGHDIDPGALNDYLLSNNGYTKNGNIIWNKLSRYTKINESEATPTLEYQRIQYSADALKSEIDLKRPSLVKILDPVTSLTHFVVSKGYDDSDIFINDPASTSDKLAAFPGKTFKSLDTFTPSQTDLSYINFYIEPSFDVQLTSVSGNPVLFATDTEEPVMDGTQETTETLRKPLKLVSLSKPTEDKYKIKISGSGAYNGDLYLFDLEGNSFEKTLTGNLKNGTHMYYVFLENEAENDDVQKIDITYLLKLLSDGYKNKKVEKSHYMTWTKLLSTADNQYNKGNKMVATGLIKQVNLSMSIVKGRGLGTALWGELNNVIKDLLLIL